MNNLLIPLPDFELPEDFPWKIGFVKLTDDKLKKLRCSGHFVPGRFFGYYFQGSIPMAVSGSWTVTLEPVQPISLVPALLDQVTQGQFSIASNHVGSLPPFVLIHDRRDGTCWLWSFDEGVRFVEATEPIFGDDSSGNEQKSDLRSH